MARGGSLQPAHSGYFYQDIATAYVLVRGLVDRYDEMIVDRKIVEDDRIDDLEIRAQGRRVRRQFKSSQNARRALAEDDFTANASSLQIDRLVLTHVRDPRGAASEYRLCATWLPPEEGDPLWPYLFAIEADGTILGHKTISFRLRGSDLWPPDGEPAWRPLQRRADEDPGFGRADFIDFCDRFVIELGLPMASRAIASPGALERALVHELGERVGIGRYPNAGRSPGDVAGVAITLATIARTQGAALTPADIERELDLRLDFGRVAQSFPLDAERYHDRPAFRDGLRRAVLAGRHQLVLGPPGAGKSWELTRLAEELRDEGIIAARHYCYLEPGDELVERRVTTDVFFANVLAELVDANPDLRGSGGARYAAGVSELESALAEAAVSGRPTVVIVDGVDHIARVRTDARGLSDSETDIVEQLATLQIPAGVSFVIGSQPGEHLDPLKLAWRETLNTRHIPSWNTADLAALARLHGVDEGLENSGVHDATERNLVVDTLARQADGNPLYARYLSRGLVSGVADGTIPTPVEWLEDAPLIEGDISSYYAHLYQGATEHAQVVADLLGVIDFAVTERDLQEMLGPATGAWVPAALRSLESVLTSVAGQGGVRVFHESFRRFMTEELARQGRTPADALEPVIGWLRQRGFFTDARAYRFLLPALRRARRGAEVLELVDVSFVSTSVEHGHRSEAILRNLALAANVAAERRAWHFLVRCIELHRAVYTCFDEGQNDWHDYWRGYLAIFGPNATSERLLFDGRCTLPPAEGLAACSLVDDAGGAAPWEEYIHLHDLASEAPREPHDSFDADGALNTAEEIAIARVHGVLRLGERKRVFRGLLRYLHKQGGAFKPRFIRALAARIARTESPALVERVAQVARGRPGITARATAMLWLGAADEHLRREDATAAAEAATRALDGADTPELAAYCFALGAPVGRAIPLATDPRHIAIAVGPDDFLHDAKGVRAWVASIRLHAANGGPGEQILDSELQRLEGVGWYRCWLRFVIAIARVDAARRAGETGDIAAAFRELTVDVHPFTGKPRACDLWTIRRVIRASLEWGLSLVRAEADWSDVLDSLTTASSRTASRLDREEAGPIATGELIELLLPHLIDPLGGREVHATVERLLVEESHTYYSYHAANALRLARARQSVGELGGAMEAWQQAGVYLAAYGFHKDITVFDLIESAPKLRALSEEAAFRAVKDARILAQAVVAHTDQRETRHAPNAWFKALLDARPSAAIATLARTIHEPEGWGGWPIYDAIAEVARRIGDLADPSVASAVRGLPLVEPELDDSPMETDRRDAQPQDRRAPWQPRVPPFPPGAATVDLLAGLRAASEKWAREDDPLWDDVVSALSYHVSQLAAQNRGDDASRILRFFAREVRVASSGNTHPLGRLAAALESAGDTRLAAEAYALAYASSRGGGGWLRMGDEKQGHLVAHALAMDADVAWGVLAQEVAHALRGPAYTAGMSRHLVERLAAAGEGATAHECWREALAVMTHRLPLAPSDGWFAPVDEELDWTVDEAGVCLLLAQLADPDLERKLSALAGISAVVCGRPKAVIAPLRWWLTRDASVTSVLLVLEVLRNGEPPPFPITQALEEELRSYVRCDLWGIAALALHVVRRIDALEPLPTLSVGPAANTALGKVNPHRERDLLRADVAGVVDDLLPLWPGIRSDIAMRIDVLSTYSSTAERAERRYRLAWGQNGTLYPPIPTLLWEWELFNLALHESLWGVREQLWRRGRATPQSENAVLARVMPDVRLHLALRASRTARPSLARPSVAVDGIGDAAILGGDDRTHPGWVRIASVEREYLHDASAPYDPPTEAVTLFAGLVAVSPTTTIPQTTFPFRDGDVRDWWRSPDSLPSALPTILPFGPLIRLIRVSHWLGDEFVLVPPLMLAQTFGLQPPKFGARLTWNDSGGVPAVALRTWNRRKRDSVTDQPVYGGCDLVLRPDLFHRLEVAHALHLKELRFVMRTPTRGAAATGPSA